ncbi:MAG: RNA-directed DNA polymerase [Sphingobacteriales bacterium JAD_PAG50586_3]|nr:MAG: RNA-directed DNA polymerase [Sphingobacteriales bacterium JAD_PAG50586_3]
MNQNFTPTQLFNLLKKNELYKYGISKDDLLASLKHTTDSIIDNTIQFNIFNKRDNFSVGTLEEKLVLRKLNDNILRIYKGHQANRKVIVSQISILLAESYPGFVIKTDLKSFFESIDRNRLLEKLHDNSILSYYSLQLLKNIFSNPVMSTINGLPRGINVSSTLSEIYMQKFDKIIRRIDGVYYYARYVDDIVIFINSERLVDNVKSSVINYLEIGLELNEKKTQIYSLARPDARKPLEFLGYKFTVKRIPRKPIELSISIADKKIKRIKTRIVKSFLDYLLNGDFNLLENRVKFLSGNFSIKSNKKGNILKAGIYYNYSQVNDLSVLTDLNMFYHKLLNSKKTSLGVKINASLTTVQKYRLSKYSFVHGYINKVYYKFRPETIVNIKRCWI